MSLNKKRMVREIGRRTRLKNRDVERVIETLVEVWSEELQNDGRIELQGFCTLDVQRIERLHPVTKQMRVFPRLRVTTGKFLLARLKTTQITKNSD